MGYMKIPNLYKVADDILNFKKLYAMEKIHGTSAHISWNNGKLGFFSGGAKHENFIQIFDHEHLTQKFQEMDREKVVIYGEAYGGKMQGMSQTYGKDLKFVVFDVKVGEKWLNVPAAEQVAKDFGLEFVDYVVVETDIEKLNHERDRPSVQAMRNGCGDDKEREGVVLRPLLELRKNNGERLIAKYKGEKFNETRKTRKVVDKSQAEILSKAKDIANEWATEMRLTHVLDKVAGELKVTTEELDMTHVRKVLDFMLEDVRIEGEGEIDWTNKKSIVKVINAKTAGMFKKRLKQKLYQ